jgi:hypothetical protein
MYICARHAARRGEDVEADRGWGERDGGPGPLGHGIRRSTFPVGAIVLEWRGVNVASHAKEVLAAVTP